jgi:hypothetical protein
MTSALRAKLGPKHRQGFPVVPAYRWPTTGLGLPAAGFLGAPGEFLIGPRIRADAGTDGRDEARQGMAPEQHVGHRIPDHRRLMLPISRRPSTLIQIFPGANTEALGRSTPRVRTSRGAVARDLGDAQP